MCYRCSRLALVLRFSKSGDTFAHCAFDGCVYGFQHRVAIQIQFAAANIRRSVYVLRADSGRSRSKSVYSQRDLQLGRDLGYRVLEGACLCLARIDIRFTASQAEPES